MVDPKSLLDKIVGEGSKQMGIPSVPTAVPPQRNLVHLHLCEHGNKISLKELEIILTLPSDKYNDMRLALAEGECFAVRYADQIGEWLRDLIPCHGLCHKYVIRGVGYYYNGGYWCEVCHRKRFI